MEVKYEPSWISRNNFTENNPLDCQIDEVRQNVTEKGSEYILYFRVGRTPFRVSLWGANLRELVNSLGKESDKWKDASFSLMQEEDTDGRCRRVISNVRKAKAQ